MLVMRAGEAGDGVTEKVELVPKVRRGRAEEVSGCDAGRSTQRVAA